MKSFLPLCFLLLQSCSVVPSSVHSGQALGLTGMVFDDLQAEITGLGYTNSEDLDSSSSMGIRYEAFSSSSTSLLIGVESVDLDGRDSWELSLGWRWYSMADQAFQPFLQMGFFGSDGQKIDGTKTSAYGGVDAGAGVAWFLSGSAAVEAGLKYGRTLVNPETDLPGNSIETELSGLEGWVGLSFFF